MYVIDKDNETKYFFFNLKKIHLGKIYYDENLILSILNEIL